MLRRAFYAFLPLILLVALPVALRERPPQPPGDALVLVIVTPNNESIRHEFARGFTQWYQAKYQRAVRIDWRTPGGTSDIVRLLDDQYQGAFRRQWQADHGAAAWTPEVAGAFNNRKLDPSDPKVPEDQRAARAAFLASDVGVGMDLFFGGGQYDHQIQADKGHLVDAGLLKLHPDWFTPAIIPQTWSGETFYDKKGRYYGTCLAAFGICYNPDVLATLPAGQGGPPVHWGDLGAPRLRQLIGLADPTKSGSINKCFEMLIQEQLARRVDAAQAAAPDGKLAPAATQAALAAGWADGLNLIKRIGGNARYFTDSASKIPRDVATGDLAAGMCIDFYGRGEADWTAYQSGAKERVVYVTPQGGSSISVDPIGLLRGAPHRELAVAFIEYVLSTDGQKLWNYKVGTPGGPDRYALRRLPVRRDLYTEPYRPFMSDPQAAPYDEASAFQYHPAWTARYFGLIRVLIRATVLDSDEELRDAWSAILAAGGPERVPQAMAAFDALPFSYAEADEAARRSSPGKDVTPLAALQTVRGWSDFARDHYRQAAALARAGK